MSEAAYDLHTQESASFATAGEALAPRINIETFCTSPEFAEACQAAAIDRRMAKTNVRVEMGGADAAAKRFASVATPHLIVVESAEGGFNMFGELEALAAVCDEDTKVIVAGPSNDVTIYRELLRQGVSEYLVTPCSAVQLIDAVTTIFGDPEQAPTAKVISVFGVKGGVGSSILAHNLSWAMSVFSERETLLVDMDVEFGTAALDFNVEAKHSVVDALSDLDGLDEMKLARLIYSQSDNLKLLPAPAAVHTKVEASEDGVLTLLDTVRVACDTAVLDLPHCWTPGIRTAMLQSNEIVLVATPDLASLRNLKTAYDYLTNARRNDAPPKIVLNQTGVPKRPEIPARDFADIVGAPLDLEIPFDAALFGAALNNGQMLAEVQKKHKIIDMVDDFSKRLLGMKAASAPKSSAFDLKSIIGSLGKS